MSRSGRAVCRRAPQIPGWETVPELNRQQVVRLLALLAARIVTVPDLPGRG
ncbi:hypothetical protein [Streptomyces sp. NPDC053048]|uniref:hypothetical protein n=1 Tax=Streptomyces sp. NPDC053048 TaxID=3365694 RepID=UPI0037D1ECF2